MGKRLRADQTQTFPVKASEEVYRALFEQAVDGVFITDNQGRFLEVNPSVCKTLGYTLDEIQKLTLHDLVPPQDLQQKPLRLEELRAGKALVTERRLRTKDGRFLFLEVSSRMLPDGKLLGIARDVTKRKQAESALRESEKRYRHTLDNMLEGCQIIDPDLRYVYVNPVAAQQGHHKPQELLGHTMPEIYPEIEQTELIAVLRRCMEQRRTESMEYEFTFPDGTFGWFELRMQPVPEGLFILSMDITQRKRAEQALRDSEDRYRDLVENSQDLVYTHDLDGRILSVNPLVERSLGHKTEALLKMSIQDTLTPEARPRYREYIAELRKRGYAEGHVYVQTVKGEVRIWEYKNTLRTEGVAEPIVRGLARDITERMQAEAAVHERTRDLEALLTTSTQLRKAQRVADVFPVLLGEIHHLLEAQAGAVILLDPDGKHITVEEADGLLDSNLGRRFPSGEGISARVLSSQEPYATEDLAADPLRPKDIAGVEQIGPAIFVPLRSEAEFLGLLVAARFKGKDTKPFSPAAVRLLSTLGEMAGNTLRRARLFDDAERRLKHTQALRNIDVAISGSLDIRVTLQIVLEEVARELGADAADVLLYQPSLQQLEFAAGQGFRRPQDNANLNLRLGEGLAGKIALQREPIDVPHLGTHQDDFVRQPLSEVEGFVSYFGRPLLAKGKITGVLEVFHRSPLEPDQEWLTFLDTLSGQAAIAIDNASLFQDLQRSNMELFLAYDKTLEGWSAALDLRDKETEGHTQRVTEMTVKLAEAMGLAESELVHVRRGALLHDIGKMGIPDSILLKPDNLTDEEWEIMRRHPTYAYELLKPIDYLSPALDIPYCHHEKWDGSGYPRGLKGTQIPLSARIFAVVDVYDALTSDRPYREAWSRKKTLKYIHTQSGSHFDPQVIEVFENYMSAD
jgi:PAS domain S-box-containing protein